MRTAAIEWRHDPPFLKDQPLGIEPRGQDRAGERFDAPDLAEVGPILALARGTAEHRHGHAVRLADGHHLRQGVAEKPPNVIGVIRADQDFMTGGQGLGRPVGGKVLGARRLEVGFHPNDPWPAGAETDRRDLNQLYAEWPDRATSL